MPLNDGTGPWNQGRRIGKGLGGRCSCFGYRNIPWKASIKKGGFLPGIALPLLTALVREMLNPSGVLRQILNNSSRKKMASTNNNSIRETECMVIDTIKQPALAPHQRKTSK